MTAIKYDVIGKSITGALHAKVNSLNQDSIAFFKEESAARTFAYGIVSDGHGSKKCFRSHLGSSFATEVLSEIFSQLAFQVSPDTNLPALKEHVTDNLPRIIVAAWRELVNEHLKKFPYSADDLQLLSLKKEDLNTAQYERSKYMAYGATLLGVLLLEKQIIYVQIGDGDILITTENGETYRRLPDDGKSLGNETTSLCLETAANEFRTAIDFIQEAPPALVLIVSDGFANAYTVDEEFFKFPQDIFEMYGSVGLEYIDNSLADWLEDITVNASGDDTSMCLIFSKKDVINEIVPVRKSNWKDNVTKLLDPIKKFVSLK